MAWYLLARCGGWGSRVGDKLDSITVSVKPPRAPPHKINPLQSPARTLHFRCTKAQSAYEEASLPNPKSTPLNRYEQMAKALRKTENTPANLSRPFNSRDYIGAGARHSGQFVNPPNPSPAGVAGSEYERESMRRRESDAMGGYYAPTEAGDRIDSYSTQGLMDALGLKVGPSGSPILNPRDEFLLNDADFTSPEDQQDPEAPRQKMLRKLLFDK